MPEITASSTPREIDEHLAELHSDLARLDAKQASAARTIMDASGSRRRYQGGRPAWDLTFDQAFLKLQDLAHGDDWKAREAKKALDAYASAGAAIMAKRDDIKDVEKLYTGWSRFFVVTSSAGHIHSSMSCSTCYHTTTYGWLPHLSGKTEAEAVEACGPALCSVCFPSAPVAHQGGKITQVDAAQLAQGKTMADLEAERQAERDAKEAKKAAKAERARQRAEKLMAKVDKFYEANGGFDAVMAMELYAAEGGVSWITRDLQTTVQDVILDDHREFHGQRRYGNNPRALLEEVA